MGKKQQNVLIFRNARIRYFDVRRKKEQPPFVRLALMTDLSDTIRLAMGWSIGDGQVNGKFAGSVTATHMILTPNQKRLPTMEVSDLQMNCDEVGEFQFIEHLDSDGYSKGADLTFVVRSSDPEAAAKLDAYWRTMLGEGAELRVGFTQIGKLAAASSDGGEENENA